MRCPLATLPPLAQAEPVPTKALIWSAVLIVVLLVLFGAIKLYRRWMNEDDDDTTGAGFTLSDLRKFHKAGKMTDEEFEKAKAIMLGSLKAAADKPVLGPRTTKPADDDGRDGPA